MARRLLGSLLLAAALLAVAAAPSLATPVLQTFITKPITIAGYSVEQRGEGPVARPAGDGMITRMEADVIDPKTGAQVPINRIMLHHILFLSLGGSGGPSIARSFYGDGEERANLVLPPGYGLPIRADEPWAMVWMLMNHRAEADSVRIRWRVWWDTDPSLTPVEPVGFDASHLRQGLVYDVAGGGLPGATDVRTFERPSPVTGRIVAGLGHVHGGAQRLELTQPTCGDRVVYRSQPTWGLASHPFYNVRPILHEPGPINMSQLVSPTGIPVVKGQPLRLRSVYDATRPHTRVMGLMVVYIALDDRVTDGCGPLPADVQNIGTSTPGRLMPPVFTVPLTGLNAAGRAVPIDRPPGRVAVSAGNASVAVGDAFYGTRNISIPQGGSVTWKFGGDLRHDVTLASGPRGFSSNQYTAGKSFTRRFGVPGRYRIFCSLHPVQMTQVVTVRPRR